MSTQDGNVTVNGISIRYRVDGVAGKPWLILSNSLMTDLSLWDDQVAAFGGAFRILRYDQRGHGKSTLNDTPCDLELLTDDVMSLANAVGVDSFTFIGVSMGAITGLRLVQRFPSRAKRAVICAGRTFAPPAALAAWDERIAVANKDGMEGLVEVTAKRWFDPGSFDRNPKAIARVREMIRTTPRDGFIACARMLQGFDIRAEMSGIRVPALFVAGASDADAPQAARQMQGEIAGSAVTIIPNTGHLANIETPSAFNAAVSNFLAR
jgi:3-oxoadipate enol-lactonase